MIWRVCSRQTKIPQVFIFLCILTIYETIPKASETARGFQSPESKRQYSTSCSVYNNREFPETPDILYRGFPVSECTFPTRGINSIPDLEQQRSIYSKNVSLVRGFVSWDDL